MGLLDKPRNRGRAYALCGLASLVNLYVVAKHHGADPGHLEAAIIALVYFTSPFTTLWGAFGAVYEGATMERDIPIVEDSEATRVMNHPLYGIDEFL